MEWFFIEMLFALLVAIVIVWWTARARRKPGAADDRDRERSQ